MCVIVYREKCSQFGCTFFVEKINMILNLKEYIENLIANDELWRFYKTKEWIQLRDSILEKYNNECQICRANGVIKRYDVESDGTKRLIKTVHHVQFVRKHPELALSEFYYYQGEKKRNLIPVCKSCHNKLHPEKQKRKSQNGKEEKFVNEERW